MLYDEDNVPNNNLPGIICDTTNLNDQNYRFPDGDCDKCGQTKKREDLYGLLHDGEIVMAICRKPCAFKED